MTTLPVETLEGFVVNIPFVLLHSSAWVQGDVGEGSVVENGQDGFPLLGIVPPEAHLDGKGQVGSPLDGLGYLFYDVGVCQDARAAPVPRTTAK